MLHQFKKSTLLLTVLFAQPNAIANAFENNVDYQLVRPEYDNTMNHTSASSIVFMPYYHLAKPLDASEPSEYHQLKSLLKLMLLELPLVSLGQTVVHELGHGFRGRDIGVSSSYDFGLPMPYSALVHKQEYLGRASYETGKNLRRDEINLIEIGGLEANKVQANYLMQISAESGVYDRPTANLYFVTKLSTPLYGFIGRNKKDIEGEAGIQNTRSKAWLNLVDPYILATALRNGSYIRNGYYDQNFPWLLDNKNFKFTPSLSYNIVPFGESYGINVIADHLDMLQSLSFNVINYLGAQQIKETGPFTGYNLDYKLHSLNVSPGISLDLRFAVGKQPFYSTGEWDQLGMACAGGGGLTWSVTNKFKIGMGILKKNAGYFPDQTIHSGTVWNIKIQYPYF